MSHVYSPFFSFSQISCVITFYCYFPIFIFQSVYEKPLLYFQSVSHSQYEFVPIYFCDFQVNPIQLSDTLTGNHLIRFSLYQNFSLTQSDNPVRKINCLINFV